MVSTWCRHDDDIVLRDDITGPICRIPSHRRRRHHRLVLARRSERRRTRWRRTLSLEADTERCLRRGARQNTAGSGCCGSAACVQCLASPALALHAATAGPRHGSCHALITLTRRPLGVSRALHVLSSCVLCLAPPAVDLLEALVRCVCTSRACCFCLRMSHFCCFRSASSSGLARRHFTSLSLASCSNLLDVAHSHGLSLLRRLVCTRWACCFCLRMWHICCFR